MYEVQFKTIKSSEKNRQCNMTSPSEHSQGRLYLKMCVSLVQDDPQANSTNQNSRTSNPHALHGGTLQLPVIINVVLQVFVGYYD